jgi:hypothetical protein
VRSLFILLALAGCGGETLDEQPPAAVPAERPTEPARPAPLVPPVSQVDTPEVTDPRRREPVRVGPLVPPVIVLDAQPAGAARSEPPASERPLVPPVIVLP